MGESMKIEVEVLEGRAPYALSTVPIPEGWEWRGEFRAPKVGEAFAGYAGVGFVEGSPEFYTPCAILHRKLQPKPGEVWEVTWAGGRKAQYLVTALNGSYVALRLDGTGTTATGRCRTAEGLFDSLSSPYNNVATRVDPPSKSVPPSDTWVPTGFEWRGEVRGPRWGDYYYHAEEGDGEVLWALGQHVTARPILHPAPRLGDIWCCNGSRYLITSFGWLYAALCMDGSGRTANGWEATLLSVLPSSEPVSLDNRPNS